MSFEVIRADITDLPFRVDAIVNTARGKPGHGDGTDRGIFAKAGPKLLEDRMKLGYISEGESAITDAYELNADYIIHTVAPVWKKGKLGETDILRQCYKSIFALVDQDRSKPIRSIAFPLIASGNLGFPKDAALSIALSCIMEFCFTHENTEIYLVLFDRESCKCANLFFKHITDYIDDAYYEPKFQEEYTQDDGSVRSLKDVQEDIYNSRKERDKRKDTIELILSNPPSPNFGDILNTIMNVLKSIDKPKITQASLDRDGYISKQYLGKILKGKSQPGKEMAVSIAIGLKLNLKHTQQLIFHAHHRLNEKEPWDKIIIDAISANNYDISAINMLLEEHGLTVYLGSGNNQ